MYFVRILSFKFGDNTIMGCSDVLYKKISPKTNWDFRYDLKLFFQIKNILDLKIGLAVIVVERGWERRGFAGLN